MAESNIGYETGKMPAKPIIPLASLEEYQKLSAEQRQGRYVNVLTHQLTKATFFSSNVPEPSQYLLDDLERFAGSYQIGDGGSVPDAKSRELQLARRIYIFESLVSTAIKRLVSFAVTPVSFENIQDSDFGQIINFWLNNLTAIDEQQQYAKGMPGIQAALRKIVRRLLIDGDVIVTETWSKVKVPIVNGTSVSYKSFSLPTRLEVHDLANITIDELSALYGREVIKLKVPQSLIELVKKEEKSKDEKLLIEQINPDIIKQIKDGEEEVQLYDTSKPKNQSLTTHLKIEDDDFAVYGRSYLLPAFEAVARKHRLKALDEATIAGMINRITIIKAGMIDAVNSATTITPERLQALENLISEPKTNELLIWPGDDIDVLDIGSDGKIFSFEGRYDHVDREILAALGLPRILIDGYSETRTDNAYVSFSGVVEFLNQDVRNAVILPFLTRLVRNIAEENGKYKNEFPVAQMSRMNLHDPEHLRAQSQFYYDRGLVSEKTTLGDGGFDFEVERARRERESTEGISSQYGIPILPFNSDPAKNPGGRPTNVDKNTQPDGPNTNTDQTSSQDTTASLAHAAIDLKSYIRDTFDSHTNKILDRVESKDISKKAVLGALIVLFGSLESRSLNFISESYNEFLEGADSDDDIRLKINKFVSDSYGSWQSALSDEIDKIDFSLPAVEKAAALAVIFASSLSRHIHKYDVAFRRKAEISAKVTISKAGGKTWATWETSFENSCGFCEEMHGKSMPIEDIVDLIPAHPNCSCSYVDHSSKPSGADTDIPNKDPNDWGKVI